MKEIENWHNEAVGKKVVDALKKNLFDAVYFPTAEEAVEYILNYVNKGDKVGFGGSMTVKSMNIQDKVKEKGAIVLDHGDPNLSPEEKLEVMRAQLTCDLFLCSSNAITLNGELVNVDGVGNRVAALSFGPKKVIIVAGTNKICKDEDAAFERIKMIAAPKNTKRLNLSNPCIKTGFCVDCNSETRICRIYTVIKKKPMLSDITVVIVGEELGL